MKIKRLAMMILAGTLALTPAIAVRAENTDPVVESEYYQTMEEDAYAFLEENAKLFCDFSESFVYNYSEQALEYERESREDLASLFRVYSRNGCSGKFDSIVKYTYGTEKPFWGVTFGAINADGVYLEETLYTFKENGEWVVSLNMLDSFITEPATMAEVMTMGNN